MVTTMSLTRPRIDVRTVQSQAVRGDNITININLSQKVPRLYIRVIDPKGRKVWDNVPITRRARDEFRMVIGTSDFVESGEYSIQVSSSPSFSPIGVTTLKVLENSGMPIIIPIIPLSPSTHIEIEEWWLYTTEMDHRVCPICRETSNKLYPPGAKRPSIPRHPNCRCFYEVTKEPILVKSASIIKAIAAVMTVSKIRGTTA